jgi:hypothetical protein
MKRFNLSCLLLLVIMTLPQLAPVRADVTISAIDAAWKKRKTEIKSIDIQWTETQQIPKGMVSFGWSLIPGLSAERNPQKKLFPAEDVRLQFSARMILRGNDLRYSTKYPAWDEQSNQYVLVSTVTTNNAQDSREFRDEHYREPPLRGSIHPQKDAFNPDRLATRPLFDAIFPGDSYWNGYRINRPRISVAEKKKGPDGIVEVEERDTKGLIRYRWVLNAKDLLPRGQSVFSDGKPWREVKIEYSEIDGLLIPSKWQTTTYHAKEKLLESIECARTQCSVNPSVEDSTFDIAFPPGTQLIHVSERRISTVAGTPKTEEIQDQDLIPGRAFASWILWLVACGAICFGIIWYRVRRWTRSQRV